VGEDGDKWSDDEGGESGEGKKLVEKDDYA
jgi:hypothetical protein